MASIAARQFTDLKGAYQRASTRLHHPSAAVLVPLALLLLFAFAYTPPRWQDWNQNSRFNLTRAIVDRGTVRIDAYAGNTGDYALVDGHIYTDKAPGLSFMAVPVYAVTEVLEPYGWGELAQRIGSSGNFESTLNPDGQGLSEDRVETAAALYVATVLTVSVPAVIMLLLLFLMIQRLAACRTAATLSVLLIGLATPVFSYSQAFYGHIPAAACVVGILAIIILNDEPRLSSRRLLAIGLLAGWAVVIEYPVAVILAPIGIWLVVREGRPAVGFGLLGMIPPLVTLVAYDLIAFGTILPVGYEHSALWQEQHSTGFMSLTYPHIEAIWGLTFSRYRGLFFFAPVLLLIVPGFIRGLRRPRARALFLPLTISALGFFLFIASSIMWWGGFAVGPRYLVPIIPLLALPLGMAIAYINSLEQNRRAAGLLVVAGLGAVSALITWTTTFARQNYPPDELRDPLASYAIPAMRDGDVARNLGMALQLDGIASLAPLVAITMLGTIVVGARLLAVRAVTA